jgi:2-C-methyl-D-erythritol 4-phosphate cytidylyltransferase
VLGHALERTLAAREVDHVVIVAPASHRAEAGAVASGSARPEVVDVVAGGPRRTDSVAAGLAALWETDRIVLVHDAARALAPPALFSRLVREVGWDRPAVVPGVPLADTVKQVDGAGDVVSTPDRATLRAIQTPQAFLRSVLQSAHAGAHDATDDAALVERAGGRVRVVEGDPAAFKITTAEDLATAERLLAAV